jgi:hypothetical protein
MRGKKMTAIIVFMVGAACIVAAIAIDINNGQDKDVLVDRINALEATQPSMVNTVHSMNQRLSTLEDRVTDKLKSEQPTTIKMPDIIKVEMVNKPKTPLLERAGVAKGKKK